MRFPKISLGPFGAFLGGWRISVCAALAFLGSSFHGHSQSILLSMSASPSPVTVSNTLTYTLNLTNQTGFVLQSVFVTNTLPSSVQLLSASNSFGGSILTNGNQVTFVFAQILFGQNIQMGLTVLPTQVGNITNSAAAFTFSFTNSASTNLVTQVLPPVTSLSVGIAGPSVPVFVNDWMAYQVSVSNLGSSVASGIVLSNSLPAGVGFIGVQPTNQPFTLTSGAVLLNINSLTNGQNQSFFLRVQPTNAGVVTLSTTVSASGAINTNTANATASTNINVSNFLPGLLSATSVSNMTYNPQTGLMDQTVRLSNIGTSVVRAARIIVSGLTNWLYNAAGTNNGNPFVSYNATLDLSQSVDLALEYFVPTRLPITVPDSAYNPVEVSSSIVPIPGGTSFAVTLVTNLAPGAILIEFQSVPGRSYTILYSGSSDLTNALVAQPSIVAPADRVQWIDDGPPKTISSPTNVSSRFYRVILNP